MTNAVDPETELTASFSERVPGIEIREWVREMRRRYLLQHETATEFWLIRHGDCYEQEFPAHLEVFDPPLSELGRLQAQALSKRVADSGIVAIYASHLQRAQETARIAAAPLGLEPEIFEDLQELRISLDGPDRMSDVRQAALDAVLYWRVGKRPVRPVMQEETRSAAAERMSAVINSLAERHSGKRVAVVAHGSVISSYLADIMSIPQHQLRIYAEYTSISVVRINGRHRMVGVINDAWHLAGLPHLPFVEQ